jgi:hypothetical protein
MTAAVVAPSVPVVVVDLVLLGLFHCGLESVVEILSSQRSLAPETVSLRVRAEAFLLQRSVECLRTNSLDVNLKPL